MAAKSYRILGLLLTVFFLQSCLKECREWRYRQIRGSCTDFSSEKIVLAPENTFRGLELEFSRTSSGNRCYLNAFSLSFVDHTKLTLTSDGETAIFYGEKLEGGERLILSEEAGNFIIGKLIKNQSIILSIGRYKETLIPTKFSILCNKLELTTI